MYWHITVQWYKSQNESWHNFSVPRPRRPNYMRKRYEPRKGLRESRRLYS